MDGLWSLFVWKGPGNVPWDLVVYGVVKACLNNLKSQKNTFFASTSGPGALRYLPALEFSGPGASLSQRDQEWSFTTNCPALTEAFTTQAQARKRLLVAVATRSNVRY